VLGNVLYRDEASHKANRVIWKIEGEGDNLFLINLGSSNTIDSSKMYKSIIMGLGIDGGTTTSSQFHLQDVVFDLNPATLGINLGVAVVRPIQEYISNKANWKVIQEEQKCTNALNGLDDQQRRVSALKEVMTTGAYFDNIVKSLSDLVEAAKNYKTAMAAVTKDGYLPNCKVAYELAFNMFKLVLRWQSLMVMFHALLELHQQALGAFLMMREMENARAGVEGKIMQELLDHHKKGKCASNCYVYKT
jgi:hypothetical protein